MAEYRPGVPPQSLEPQAILNFLERELGAIARAVNDPGIAPMQVLNAPPPKPRRGMLVYADGTNWDPGSGEGTYRFNGSVWLFVG